MSQHRPQHATRLRATLIVYAVIVAGACRGRERAQPARDAARLPADASADAPWRKDNYLGNLSDIQPLLDRDCPPNTPPPEYRGGYGREVDDAGLHCLFEVRPGVWRLRVAYATPKGQTPDVMYLKVGFYWSAGLPYPAECERARDVELLEYYRALVRTPGTGTPPSRADDAAVQRALVGHQSADLETSTGPLAIRFGGNRPESRPDGEDGACVWTLYGGFEIEPALPGTKRRGSDGR